MISSPATLDDALARELEGLVLHRVAHEKNLLPPRVDADNLISVGWLGVIAAVRTYQPARGSLTSWVYIKVRSHVRREIRRLARRNIPEVPIEVLSEAGREPSAPLAKEDQPDFFAHYRDRLPCLLRSLKARERSILRMYYEEGLTQGQIGEHLGVDETRVSQIRRESLKFLKMQMA